MRGLGTVDPSSSPERPQQDDSVWWTRSRIARTTLGLALFGLLSALFVRSSWVGDDAYIIFRAVDNLHHGYGLRWNVAERVQVFTCPLWTLLVAGVSFVTSDFYYTVLALSFVLCLASVLWAWHRRREQGGFFLLVLLLASSKAFVDYTSSGLETPLSFLLVLVFYLEYFHLDERRMDARRRVLLALVAGLAFTTRPDTALLYVLPLGYLAVAGFRRTGIRGALELGVGALPVLVWEAVSVVYYGFLFPNSYYAKLGLGIPAGTLLRQGAYYLWNSLLFDPITLVTVLFALVYAALGRRLRPALAAASALLYVAYTVRIGGDFMSGRFFALPFVVSALVLSTATLRARMRVIVVSAVLVYNLVHPWSPARTDPGAPWDHPFTVYRHINDEAGGYRRGTSMLLYFPFTGDLPSETFPKHDQYERWAKRGSFLREAGSQVAVPVGSGVGYLGFFAGPRPFIIDGFAVTDPLLARLIVPAEARLDFAPGHVLRPIPAGYVESVITGENRIEDPELASYYERLSLVTRGPLWSRERFRAILAFNVSGMQKYRRPPTKVVAFPWGSCPHWP